MKVTYKKRNRKVERKQKSSIILFLRNKNPVNTIYSMFLLKNWCFQTVVLEKILESPLDSKEIKSVNLKGNQTWIFTGGTGAEAEAPMLWPPDAKNWLTGKDPVAGKVWWQEEKWVTEDGMAGWHHWLNGHEFEFEQTLEDGEGWGSLVCCSSWGHKELDTTERLNNNSIWYSYRIRIKLIIVEYLFPSTSFNCFNNCNITACHRDVPDFIRNLICLNLLLLLLLKK